MKKIGSCSLVLLVVAAVVVLAGSTRAGADVSPVCIGLKRSGLGAPSVTLTLSAVPYGAFVHLAGQGRFSQSIAPPGNLVVYGVSGPAIPNADGWWLSLEGAGYDVASTVYRGTFAIQLSADPAKSTLSYTRQALDGSSSSTLTGPAEIIACPE